MTTRVYTIGHSTRGLADFVGLLTPFGIEIVADVRSVPHSAHNPQFDMAALQRSLPERGIRRESRTAIMCAEAVPWQCHRSPIGDALLIRGVDVVDIISAGSVRQHRLTPFASVKGTSVAYPAS